jgi:hypothetical protein
MMEREREREREQERERESKVFLLLLKFSPEVPSSTNNSKHIFLCTGAYGLSYFDFKLPVCLLNGNFFLPLYKRFIVALI